MFILYALLAGLLAGFLLGGSTQRLGALNFRFGWLMLAGLVVQIVLFSAPVAQRIGSLGPAVYVGSTVAVLVAVARNWRITGVPIVVAGAASNLAAIVANGGYMPADPVALAAVGHSIDSVYSNSTILANPALWPLTDILALPSWLPFANVFSIGDIAIGFGVAMAIVAAMRGVRNDPAAPAPLTELDPSQAAGR